MKKLVAMMTMLAAFALVAMPVFAGSYISIGQESYADLQVNGGDANIHGEFLVEGRSSSINGNTWAGMGSTFQSNVYGGSVVVEGIPVATGAAGSSISSNGEAYAYQNEGYASSYVNSDTVVFSASGGDGFSGVAVSNFGYADSQVRAGR